MTDLEMTKLCAEAMGYRFVETYGSPVGVSMTYLDEHGEKHYYWRPLTNDAQAMALVKQVHLKIGFGFRVNPNEKGAFSEGRLWRVSVNFSGPYTWNADLNRAIVQCVAKMQAAKVITK